MSDIITERARFAKGWTSGGKETPCGYGSKLSSTVDQRKWLAKVVEAYDIETVADIGAGDLNWIKHMAWDVDYTPYDLVPRLPEVTAFDLVREVPPKVDCLMCLWVLNHMPFDDSRAAIANLKASGSKYLIMTDRPVWHHEQPPEIQMQALDAILLTPKGDRLKLIRL